MTGDELKRRLCGRSRSFALPTAEVKARLGDPQTITILRRWCRVTGRDVLMFTYPTAEGSADVFGAAGFLNGEEAMLDGYVVLSRLPAEQVEDDPVARAQFASGQQTLFDELGQDFP